MSQTVSQTSSTTGTSTNGLSRSLSVKTNTKTTLNNPLPPSDIKLFATNLRLLDLHLRHDWPNITTQTFSAKNADQKQRMGAVEWSLFRLFEIWDPVETSQKLQPFFPPLEPLQSRNLRAALHRSLDTLKKDGVLGREAVLRKTMLEECKGDKFYEILASFSTLVLKKVLASRPKHKKKQAIAKKLATATSLSTQSQQSLLPLAVAHKAALVNILRRKNEKRRRFVEFENVLDAKEKEISRRIRKCKNTPRARKPAVPQKEADAIKKQLKDNWVGNQRWLDVMLHGDDAQAEDAFLNSSFGQVWGMVEQGRRLEDVVPNVGLLENLQSRLEEQQARLQKWQSFHERMQKEEPLSSVAPDKVAAQANKFNFDDHARLQLPAEITDDIAINRPAIRPQYQEILSEMDNELARIASAKHNHPSIAQLRRRGSSFEAAHSPTRRRKSRSDSIPKVAASPPRQAKHPASSARKLSQKPVPTRAGQRHEAVATTPMDSEATLIGHPSTVRTAAPASSSIDSPIEQSTATRAYEPTSDPLPTYTSPPPTVRPVSPPSPSPSPPPPSSYFPSEPPVLEPIQLTEDALAAQIISTIGEATPSPVKKPQPRLSLMEPTRLSMAPHSTFNPIPESPALPSPPLPEPPTIEPDRQQSLIERTRLSMAAMSTKPRASLAPREKRKSTARQSLYPVNQFDTPRNRKSFQTIEEAKSGDKTPKEDLFEAEADYDRVFKSRPRIATSPVWGTPREDAEGEDGFDEGVTGVDLGDVDVDDDDDVTTAWDNSPLRGKRAF